MALFRKRGAAPHLRILVASDMHGSTLCLKKFLKAIELYEADVAMIAGDLTGKMIVPLVRDGDGWISHFQGFERPVEDGELVAHEDVIDSAGLYAYRTTPEEMRELASDRPAVDAIFHRLVNERLERWLELCEERLAALDTTCYLVPGNDDYREIDAVLAQVGEHVVNVDGRRVEIDHGHELVGLGVANETPWHAPRDVPEAEIGERLGELTSQLERPEGAVLLVHVPPVDSLIDLAPELDASLRPTGAGGNMVHVGSRAVRDCLAERQPLVALHGHVHESRGRDSIGRTMCINPGSEYGEGILRAVVVNVAEDRVASHLFVSG
jgi:Icc-related predicted phosphoesterase